MADRTTFFVIYRTIFENEMISQKPFDDFHAWIWLIGKAAFADHPILVRGKPHTLKRGQLFVSVPYLAKEWGWSDNKVRRFIRRLEWSEMVHTESSTLGTTLTIENYAKFQDVRQTDERTDERTGGRTDGRTGGTLHNNGVTRGNNVCDAHAAFSAPSLDEVRAYCTERRNGIDAQSFMDYYANRDWPKDWKAAIRRWESYDRTRAKAEPEQTRDEADRAWADVMALKVTGRPWGDVMDMIPNETARRTLNFMVYNDQMELKRPLADGSVQTIPNRQRFVELYRKEMMA